MRGEGRGEGGEWTGRRVRWCGWSCVVGEYARRAGQVY
eukprot:contig_1870_g304